MDDKFIYDDSAFLIDSIENKLVFNIFLTFLDDQSFFASKDQRYFYLYKNITLGAETFSNFANFAQIHESLRREKFYIDRFAKVHAREIFQFFLFFSKVVGFP